MPVVDVPDAPMDSSAMAGNGDDDSVRFGAFTLAAGDRRLLRDGVSVELNARYFDALALLVGEAGGLVSKDRFMAEVWRGVPVTDEALTQCIRTLRRALDDDAAAPRFIQTVPKHGYRFVADVSSAAGASPRTALSAADAVQTIVAAALGGGGAGAIGGLILGFGSAAQVAGGGGGSLVIVLLALTTLVATAGGAGVGTGIAAGRLLAHGSDRWSIAGGALGGLAIGGLARLFGLDAFALLLGRSPGGITGGAEGAAIGAAVGAALWVGAGRLRRAIAAAGVIGALTGTLVAVLGGQLMAGSLALLAERFPGSQLRLDWIGRLFGEVGLGPITRVVTGAGEVGLFCAGVVAALSLARRVGQRGSLA